MADAPPRKPPRSAAQLRTFGVCVIAATFGALALWSIAAPIRGAVVAAGRVVVEENRKTIQHEDGGVIAAIHVHEGDAVREGDILIELDTTVAAARLSAISDQLAELYARRARLEAERDDAQELSSPRGEASILASAAFAEKARGQRDLFAARRSTHEAAVDLLNQRMVGHRGRLQGLEAKRAALGEQRRLIREELTAVRTLRKEGFATLNRVREVERAARALDGDFSVVEASIAEARSAMAEAELEISRLAFERKEEAVQDLRETEAAIVEFEDRRIEAAQALERAAIRSPTSGRVLSLAVHTIGGVVKEAEPIMEIVPDGAPLLIEVRISPREVDRVRAGQETLIRFSGFSARRPPEVVGAVKHVSADSLIDQATGTTYYLALIEFAIDERLKRALDGRSLSPGMPVEAFIRTSAQPAISYLLRPLTDAISRSMRED